MKRALLAVMLVLAPSAQAAEERIGTLVATTSVNNSTTATTFDIPPKTYIMVQCDAAAYLKWGSTTSTAATTHATTGDKYVAANQEWDTSSTGTLVYLAAIAVSGTANCKVYKVSGP